MVQHCDREVAKRGKVLGKLTAVGIGVVLGGRDLGECPLLVSGAPVELLLLGGSLGSGCGGQAKRLVAGTP